MLANKPVGRDAATKKYDLLSALMTFALAREKRTQQLVLRLMALVTTRYNWQRDELTMGQREMAKLWSVDQRTVKRELAKLKSMNWLIVKRAGTRGRVTTYGINFDLLMVETQNDWQKMGPDFVERLTLLAGSTAQNVHETNVVPFNSTNVITPVDNGSLWSTACIKLHAQDATLYAAWLQKLTQAERDADFLTLMAPTRFHATYVETHLRDRVLYAIQAIDPSVRAIRIIV